MKHLFYIILFSFSLNANAQSILEDAKNIKETQKELWYADSSFTKSDNALFDRKNQGKKRIKTTDQNKLKKVVQILTYTAAIALAAGLIYVIYLLSKNSRRRISAPEFKEDIENIETADELHLFNFLSKIKQAENTRIAVRYYYLWLLQSLSKQGLIKFNKDKTNQQYADELKHHKSSSLFNTCTYYYNYVWYGDHMPSDEEYEKIVSYFKTLLPHE